MAEPRFDTFHLDNHPSIIDAAIDTLLVIDKDGEPNMVIDVDTPFDMKVEWHVSGLIGPALQGSIWTINVYAESMGPGPEVTLVKNLTVPFNWTGPVTTFTKTIPNIDPVDPSTGLKLDGAYKLTLVITSTNSAGVRLHLAGFVEGPLVQFYAA